jgi:hypothetical protein
MNIIDPCFLHLRIKKISEVLVLWWWSFVNDQVFIFYNEISLLVANEKGPVKIREVF